MWGENVIKKYIINKTFVGLVILSTILTIIVIVGNVSADELDQYIYDSEADDIEVLNIGHYFAQSFVPSATGTLDRLLTKTNLYMSAGFYYADYPMTFGIYQNTPEPRLEPYIIIDPITLHPPEFPNSAWITINFDDFHIIPGKRYYIVCNSLNSIEPYLYWWYGINTPYNEGCEYLASNLLGPWSLPENNQDLLFATYRDSMSAQTNLYAHPSINYLGILSKGERKSFSIKIENIGDSDSGRMYWEVDRDANLESWISEINPSWGFVPPGETTSVEITIVAPDRWGVKNGNIPIISDCGDEDLIIISFYVKFECEISTPQNRVLVGQSVQFNGEGSGGFEPYTYSWELGDSTRSYQQNPEHTYNTPGTYLVNLTITDNESSSTNATYVLQVLNLISNFSSSVLNYSKINNTIYFNNTSEGLYEINNWSWDFDDGNISYSENISHQFTNEGDYNITLTIRDNKSNENTYSRYIHIDSSPPIINSIDCNPNLIGYYLNTTISANLLRAAAGQNCFEMLVS
jgi:PKD repeat protein